MMLPSTFDRVRNVDVGSHGAGYTRGQSRLPVSRGAIEEERLTGIDGGADLVQDFPMQNEIAKMLPRSTVG